MKKVPRLGARAFELSAGFLRIVGGADPLDRSGVHPEAYPVVRKIVAKAGADIGALIGNAKALGALRPADFNDEKFGLPTVVDIFKELEKPGHDPRPAFKTAEFKEGVEKIGDLAEPASSSKAWRRHQCRGFRRASSISVPVRKDGLVHVSAMSRNFVKDPREIVKPGDIVKVKVMEVDAPRKRISLTMRLDDTGEQRAKPQGQRMDRGQERFSKQPERASESALAEALRKAAANKEGGAPSPLKWKRFACEAGVGEGPAIAMILSRSGASLIRRHARDTFSRLRGRRENPLPPADRRPAASEWGLVITFCQATISQ